MWHVPHVADLSHALKLSNSLSSLTFSLSTSKAIKHNAQDLLKSGLKFAICQQLGSLALRAHFHVKLFTHSRLKWA